MCTIYTGVQSYHIYKKKKKKEEKAFETHFVFIYLTAFH